MEAWKPRTLPLVQFLAANGGIGHNDPLINVVQGIIVGNNLFVPGHGPLIRKGGMGLDKAREAAVEGDRLTKLVEHRASPPMQEIQQS
jgi:hypothetical protein